jgi:hypothetical protein
MKIKWSYELHYLEVFIISNLLMFISKLINYLQICPCRHFHVDVHVTVYRRHSEGKELDATKNAVLFPISVHLKQPSATQPRRLSRYGLLKAEDMLQF